MPPSYKQFMMLAVFGCDVEACYMSSDECSKHCDKFISFCLDGQNHLEINHMLFPSLGILPRAVLCSFMYCNLNRFVLITKRKVRS